MEDLSKLAQPETCAIKGTLLEKYGIPIHYLDYNYVEKCKNGKELEKILHILQSGEEGYFPDLMKKTEEKLSKIKPNSKFIRKVTPVISKEFLSKDEREMLAEDLNQWLNDVNKSNEELGKVKKKNCLKEIPEVRKACKEVSQDNKASEKRIKSTDYSSWDKYDPDTEILKMDLEAEKVKTQIEIEEKEKVKKGRTVKFNEFETQVEAKFEADREREKGNEYFKAADYKEALNHYTNSINFLPSAANYNNRAITNIKLKKYENAIKDSSAALKYEPKNIKALIRLAQSHEALKNYTDAICTAKRAVEIDPNNTIAQNMLNRLNKFIGGDLKNVKTRMKIVEIKGEQNAKIQDKDVTDRNVNDKNVGKKNKVKSVVERKVANSFGDRKAKRSGNQVLLPIPGPSNMPEPYFVAVENKDSEIIKRQEYILNCRRQIVHLTNVDNSAEDNDCVEIHLEKSDSNSHRKVVEEGGVKMEEAIENGVKIKKLNDDEVKKGDVFNEDEEIKKGVVLEEFNDDGDEIKKGVVIEEIKEDDELKKGVIIEELVEEDNEFEAAGKKRDLDKVGELEDSICYTDDDVGGFEENYDENNSESEDFCCCVNGNTVNEGEDSTELLNLNNNLNNFQNYIENPVVRQFVENNPSIRMENNNLLSLDMEFVRDFNVSDDEIEEIIRRNLHQTGGGGEPHINNEIEIQPGDIDTSYGFRRLWYNIDYEDSQGYRAQILRNIDLNRLPRVIGYELDGTMLCQILKTLYQHFQVVHEIERVYYLLENLTTVRRFNLVIMFLGEDDRNKLKSLIAFLDQHGKPLPDHVKRLYRCN